jgi:hypothetical protein
MGFEILLTVLFILLLINLVILDCKLSKMKKDRLNLDVVAAIVAIETAVKKLNEKLRCETQSLSDYKQRLKKLEKRIDILEEGHPDEVDDQSNVVCVWFHGKKYVPEDKRDENTSTFYADNKVVAETSRPDPQPESRYKCSDCVRFRRERIDGKWYGICSVDNDLVSDDKQYICDKFRIYRPTEYYVSKNMGGNGKAEELPKYIVKLNYLASDTECDELLKRVERLNRIYDAGLMSLSEYGERLKEWMQNDS